MQQIDGGDLRCADTFAGALRRQPLESDDQFQDVLDGAHGQRGDRGAAIRGNGDQPFRRQDLQRLAQRRARQARHELDDFAFRDALTGREFAGDDQLPQTIRGDLRTVSMVVFEHENVSVNKRLAE